MTIGVGAPVELDSNAVFEGVRWFPQLFPFRSFWEPVFHFSFSNRSPLKAHAFLRSEIIFCPHDASPLTAHSARGWKSARQYPPTIHFLVHNLFSLLRQSHHDSATERILVIRSGRWLELDLDRVAEASCASLSTWQIQRCVMISEYNLISISLEKHLRKIRSAGSDDEVRKLKV